MRHQEPPSTAPLAAALPWDMMAERPGASLQACRPPDAIGMDQQAAPPVAEAVPRHARLLESNEGAPPPKQRRVSQPTRLTPAKRHFDAAPGGPPRARRRISRKTSPLQLAKDMADQHHQEEDSALPPGPSSTTTAWATPVTGDSRPAELPPADATAAADASLAMAEAPEPEAQPGPQEAEPRRELPPPAQRAQGAMREAESAVAERAEPAMPPAAARPRGGATELDTLH